jgi:hypothetical protein
VTAATLASTGCAPTGRVGLSPMPAADRVILPEGADPPETAYLDWHRERVYAA